MRIAHHSGRAVLVSPDGQRMLDVAKVSNDRFGPAPHRVFGSWAKFRAWHATADLPFETEGQPVVLDEFGAPSPTPSQVFAIGLNYRDHADEAGLDYPAEPPTFTKFVSSFAGPVGDLRLPTATVDWEAELVVVIGVRAEKVPAEQAWDVIAGLTVGQDYSERILQLTGPAPQFSLGKSFAGFSPQGPWLVSLDELDDPADLAISCTINGKTVQNSRTSKLIFSIPVLIEKLSAVTVLQPGDVIFTGTPAGVGGARTPRWFLKDGDVVETHIEGIGTLRQTCTSS